MGTTAVGIVEYGMMRKHLQDFEESHDGERLTKALQCGGRTLEKTPTNHPWRRPTLCEMAKINMLRSDYQRALGCYKDSLKYHHPFSPDARRMLAHTHLMLAKVCIHLFQEKPGLGYAAMAKWCGKAMVQTTPADSPRREVDRGTAGCDIHI